MTERTKTVTLYEFYYADRRPDAPAAFAANGLVVDHEAGDRMDVDTPNNQSFYVLRQANGAVVRVNPSWLWMEQRDVVVKVKPPTPGK